jgi:putative metallohydrolase (TIGR04338 family)
MRKTQQLQCYAAEVGVPDGSRFRDVAEAQRFVDELRDEPWWHLQGYSLAVLRIEVHPASRTNQQWHGVSQWFPDKSAGLVELSPSGLSTRVVLHEVAHVLADSALASTGHDPAWARTYLTLVSCVMGPDAYLKLRESFDAHGVDYDAARTHGASGIAL